MTCKLTAIIEQDKDGAFAYCPELKGCHTQGDTVVYLPKERIVCSGDLMETQPAYMGNALFDEWLKTLDALKELDFATDLPGHGVPFHDKSLITAYQSYLKDFMAQAAQLRKQGLSAEETAQKIDLTSRRGC